MVIVFGGEKGGTGKTCLSINFAICCQVRGKDVLLIDGDKQRTSVKFCERRAQLARLTPELGLRPVLCMERRGDMYDAIEAQVPKYDHIIVDVAGADTPQLVSAVMIADRLYSPFVPSESDLDTAETIHHRVELTRASGNRELKSWAVLSQVSPYVHSRESEIASAREMLEPFYHLPIAATVVHQRNAFRKAHTAKRGVVEVAEMPKAPKGAVQAADEIWALYEEITGDIFRVKEAVCAEE